MGPVEPVEVRFPTADGGEVRGMLHRPGGDAATAGLVIAHGRSGGMNDRLIRQLCASAADADIAALRFTFRYAEESGSASRDLSREETDLLGAVRYLQSIVASNPLFVAGKSMGARVCARASSDPAITGMISLGYPLHPMFKPQVMNPPEWPRIVKPALFIQGDHDPFCDLGRLRTELERLSRTHELVIIPAAGHSFEPKGEKRDTFPEVREAVTRWIVTRLREEDSLGSSE